MRNALPLLHQAVLDNNLLVIQQLKDSDVTVKDPMNFTALEIAKLLGRKECIALFEENKESPLFKIQLKDESKPKMMDLLQFEATFNIVYRPQLVFLNYSDIKNVTSHLPYLLRWELLASENYEMYEQCSNALTHGTTAKVMIKWIDDILGYGLFADEDLAADTYIGEYTGKVKKVNPFVPDLNGYCFNYPMSWFSLNQYVIDAQDEGNVTRFINHSVIPNLKPFCIVHNKLLYQVFFAKHKIKKGTQLTWNYGEDYWRYRKMVRNIVV